MRKIPVFLFALAATSVIFFLGSCGKDEVVLPTVTTAVVTNIVQSSAVGGGEVTNDGNGVVTRGVCWSTAELPTIADNHTTDGTGVGTFTSQITGLAPNASYFIRAYATNSAGTSYGVQRDFHTPL
jgi:hypothetical protein